MRPEEKLPDGGAHAFDVATQLTADRLQLTVDRVPGLELTLRSVLAATYAFSRAVRATTRRLLAELTPEERGHYDRLVRAGHGKATALVEVTSWPAGTHWTAPVPRPAGDGPRLFPSYRESWAARSLALAWLVASGGVRSFGEFGLVYLLLGLSSALLRVAFTADGREEAEP